MDVMAQIDHDFLLRFPGGLQDPAWLALGKKHRGSLQVINICSQALTQQALEDALAQRQYATITEACRQIIGRCTTVSTFEKMAFRNYLAFSDVHESFVRALHAVLYRFDAGSFADFVEVLALCRNDKNANAAKWPVVTAFLAYSHPQEHVCIKPTTVKKLAARLGVDIAYQAWPNYQTYQRVQAMVQQFRRQSHLATGQNNIITQAIMYCAV